MKVPIGKRDVVCVVLEEPYRLLLYGDVDDLSGSKGKSGPYRELLVVERLLKLKLCEDLPVKTFQL